MELQLTSRGAGDEDESVPDCGDELPHVAQVHGQDPEL